MALKAILDTVDGLPADVSKEYTLIDTDGPNKGKYQLAVEPVGGLSLEDVTGLKNSLEAVRGERDTLDTKVRAYGDITPTRAKEGVTAINKLSKLDPEKDAEKIAEAKVEAIRTQLVEAHRVEVAALKGDNDVLLQTVEKTLIDAAAETEIVKAGGDPLLLLPAVKASMKLKRNEDGSFVTQVVNKDGNPRIKDAQGAPMGVADLVGELKGHDSYSKAFAPTNKGGPGNGNQNSNVPAGTSRAKMSIFEKTDYISKHGDTAYNALPE